MNSWSNFPKDSYTAQIFAVAIAFFTISNIKLAAAVDPASSNTHALKPVMGWNSFEPLRCRKKVKERRLRYQADLLVEKGLDKCGYNTVTVECGWEDTQANDGTPSVRRKAFKGGLVPFSDYLKSKGLRLGLSTGGGPQMCTRKKRRKRSFSSNESALIRRDGNEYWKNYISTLKNWGLTYLMFRPCDWADPQRLQSSEAAKELNSRYIQMSDGIREAGANIFYATGEWGASSEAARKYQVTNAVRISDDARGYWNSFVRILNGLVPFADKAHLGSFNDLGFLQVGGNYLEGPEKVTQFIFWAAAKSPLIFSIDLEHLDQSSINMLKNPGALAVNQDDLGKSITFKRRYTGDKDIWSGPLSDGSTVAVVVNWSSDTSSKQIDLADLGFSSARLHDLWNGVDLGIAEKTFNTSMGIHGCLFLKLNETKPAAKRVFQRYPAETADLMGSARLRQVNSKVQAVSWIKSQGYGGVRWLNLSGGATKGNVLVSIDYINADLSRGNLKHANLNYRSAVIIVNDEDRVYVDFPISGQTWEDIHEGFLVSLPLRPGDSNKITIEGVNGWAPDFVCLGVEVQKY